MIYKHFFEFYPMLKFSLHRPIQTFSASNSHGSGELAKSWEFDFEVSLKTRLYEVSKHTTQTELCLLFSHVV